MEDVAEITMSDIQKTSECLCQKQITVEEQKGRQTMAKTIIPILVDWESIKDYLGKADIVEVIRCKECIKKTVLYDIPKNQ